MSALKTVQMLHEEYALQFGKALPDRPDDEAPLSLDVMGGSERVGLAFSGGGIRSATFSLGVLQALSRLHLLTAFDYLSTVSGGGYIGSWLSVWAHRHPHGIAGVMNELAPGPGAAPGSGAQEPAPIHHLRRFSNYLTPRTGVLSSDTWTIFGTYLRNLLVNWLTLVPYFAVAMLLPVLAADVLRPEFLPWNSITTVFHLDAWMAILVMIGSLLCVVATMAVLGASLPSASQSGVNLPPRWLVATTREEFLRRGVLPLVVAAAGFGLMWFVSFTDQPFGPVSQWLTFATWGVAAHLAALAMHRFSTRGPDGPSLRLRLGRTKADLARELLAVVASGAFGGWATWVVARILPLRQPLSSLDPVNVYVVGSIPLLLVGFLLAMTLYAALASRVMSEEDREWFARAGGWILALALGWVAMAGTALLGPGILGWLWTRGRVMTVSMGGLTGLVSMWLGHSGKTKAGSDQATRPTATSVAMEWGLKLAAPLFAFTLAILLASGLNWLRVSLAADWEIPLWEAASIIITGLAILIVAVVLVVNVNVFSLHGMYRDRLIRAYLGASRTRNANRFTGFDPDDNVPLAYLAWPFFSAEDWPLVCAIADALISAGASAAHKEVDEADWTLLAEVRAVASWDGARVQALVGRFNDVLISSTQPQARRREWEHLVKAGIAAPAFGVHEWWRLVAIAKALDKAVHDNQKAAIHGADDGREWWTDVLHVNIWERATVAALTARLNAAMETLTAPRPEAPIPGPEANLPYPQTPAGFRERLEALAPAAPKRPLPIVNTAINLVGGDELAWQERQADSFTLTAFHAGSPSVGFRPMAGSGRADAPQPYGGNRGVSLGTAITISGAAANPNMGYHSSPIVTLLLTLFNARLGAWLGNPADERRFSHSYPKPRLLPVALLEAFGLTHGRGGYVNLSDGGHFENLGLYELVRRGCRHILVIDAGCDENYAFEDLGNAVRKIRVDFGISVEFKGFHVGPVRPRKLNDAAPLISGSGRYVAIGDIHYPHRNGAPADGKLLYVKPAMFENDEPIDVRHYGLANPKYPHEPTTDQWFSESQFESYRALGEHILWTVSGTSATTSPPRDSPRDIDELFTRAEAYLMSSGAPVNAA